MNIVLRSVDGVNDPLKWRTLPFEGALLCQEIMIRESVKNDLVNRLFAELIHLTDGVDFPLELHFVKISEVNLLNPASLFGGRNGHLKICVVGPFHLSCLLLTGTCPVPPKAGCAGSLPVGRQEGAQYKMTLPYREAPPRGRGHSIHPKGLRLSFEVDKEKQTVKTTFVASPVFQGWDGIVHGGILSTLLDEAMATLVYELGFHAVTASMEIKFKKPAPILEPLLVYGEVTEVSRRLLRAKARIAKNDGTILAVGISTFMKLRDSATGSL